MFYKEFVEFKEHIETQISDIVNKRKTISENFKEQINCLGLIFNNCESIYKYLPDYNLPLVRVSVGHKVDVIQVEFEIFTDFDLILYSAYMDTIINTSGEDISKILAKILMFTVATIDQTSINDKEPKVLQTYNIWDILKTTFVITEKRNDKIILLVNTGSGFISDRIEGWK